MIKIIKRSDFSKSHTAHYLKLKEFNIAETSMLHKLILKLNCRASTNAEYPEGSIMQYGVICDHDDDFLCEHRLQWIVEFILNRVE